MLTQLIVALAVSGAWRPGAARQIALAKPPQFHIMNKTILVGFLGKDATVHTGINGNFTTLELATKSSYKDKESGKYISRTEWHKLIVFGGRGEYAAKLSKGDHILVEGELRHTEYESKKTNTKQQSDSVRVTNIQRLDRSQKLSSEAEDAEEIPVEEEAA
jgi:single-strand DNA-binding protein